MGSSVKTRTYDSSQGTITVRPISWATFYKIRPDRKPAAANDNTQKREAA